MDPVLVCFDRPLDIFPLSVNSFFYLYVNTLENFSNGDIEEACFWSLGVFTYVYFPEIVRKPFGKQHDEFFNAIPRGARGKKVIVGWVKWQ